MKTISTNNETKEIDTKTVYRMIYELLRRDMYYEAKCLIELFIEQTEKEEFKKELEEEFKKIIKRLNC